MAMWKFKSCPRCGGDIFLDKDKYGWYMECLKCGYQRDLESPTEATEQPLTEKELAPAASEERQDTLRS